MLLSLSQKFNRAIYRKFDVQEPLAKGSKTPVQTKIIESIEKTTPLHEMPLWVARLSYQLTEAMFGHDKEELHLVKDHTVPVDLNNAQIKIRQYQALPDSANNAKQPALMFFHGGVCVIGSVKSHDLICRYIAKKTGFKVFSVDYRLGPENKFPAAVDDSILAWNWLCKSADQLGVDMSLTGVGGDSAGGYLSTLVAQQAKVSTRPTAPEIMPAYQWLIYPMTDFRGEDESYKNGTSGMFLTRDLCEHLLGHYLNHNHERVNPLVSTILCEDVEDLPPTYVATAGHDPLMDCGTAYAEKLKAAGNTVEHEHFEHQMHGFLAFGGVCSHAMNAIDTAIDQLVQLKAKAEEAKA